MPAHPLCCIGEETGAWESDLPQALLKFPSSECSAPCKALDCPGDTVCPAFENDIDGEFPLWCREMNLTGIHEDAGLIPGLA